MSIWILSRHLCACVYQFVDNVACENRNRHRACSPRPHSDCDGTHIMHAKLSQPQNCHKPRRKRSKRTQSVQSDPTEPCGPAGLARTYQPTHTLFSRPGLSQRMSLGVQFKYGSKALFVSQTVKIFLNYSNKSWVPFCPSDCNGGCCSQSPSKVNYSIDTLSSHYRRS